MTNFRHYQDETNLFVCPITGKHADFVWSDRDRGGACNCCVHCTGEHRTPGGMLHALQTRRQREERDALLAASLS